MRILLADDEKTLRIPLRDELTDAGHEVMDVADGLSALDALEKQPFDLVLADLKMPGADGLQVLARAREKDIDVIVITGAGSVETAVEAMKAGACDYLQKPFLVDELLLVLKRVEDQKRLEREVHTLRRELLARQGFAGVVGDSDSMRKALDLARRAAMSDATVVLLGESGTGKEVLARAIHRESNRRDGAFVAIGCGTLSGAMLEDELFGHEKGAFTDAHARREGIFELADGGTLLLDDVDDMPLTTQVKLLRVLQEREFMRIGGAEPIHTDIRVIAATKKDLWVEVQEKRFREDLYYRLHVIQIDIPPLRDRLDDIPALVRHFIARLDDGASARVSSETLGLMMNERWDGNVRQLENAVRRALALRDDNEELPAEYLLPQSGGVVEGPLSEQERWALADVVRRAERAHILRILGKTGGNRTQAAELLGISRKNLWEKMKSLGIEYDSDG